METRTVLLRVLAASFLLQWTSSMAQDKGVVPGSERDIRPRSCVRGSIGLIECAKAWIRLVDGRSRPQNELWDAAEFQGFVDGIYNGSRTSGRHKWCPPVFESNDQIYRLVAEILIAKSTRLDENYSAPDYTKNAMSKLWPCPKNR